MSESYEIFINKKITTKDFYLNTLKNIIDNQKLECNEINELEGVKLLNSELFYYMDDVLNNKAFLPFAEYEETSIYNYPYLLNSNGALILIRYNGKELREPTIEEMNYFFKSNKNETQPLKVKKKLKPTNKVKSSFKKEVYKEKAMKINVKKFVDNQQKEEI